MFSSLKSSLDENAHEPDNGALIFITETPFVSANFLINYYLLQSIKEKSICFISLQNTWSHYCNIASKFGVNLRNNSTYNIKVFDFMSILNNQLEGNVVDENILLSVISKGNLKDLYNFISTTIDSFDGKPFTLIIDSLSPLLAFGANIIQIDNFIQYCHELVQPIGTLITSASVHIADKESYQLSQMMKYKCSTCLSIKELSSGWTKDIHGELKIMKFDEKELNYKLQPLSSLFHFKICDRDVTLFAPGLSSKVI